MGSGRHGIAHIFRGVEHTVQPLVILKHLTAAIHDAQQRIFSNVGKDPGFVADQVTDAPHQGTTTSQHDAAINDVGGQLSVFFVLVVAAVEVVVGLALVVAINRRRPDASVDDVSLLRG